jgi:hypothetical protein
VQVGDLIKFHDISPNGGDDIGIVIDIKGRDVTLCWAKTGIAHSTIDRLLYEKRHFEIIE